MHTLRMQSNEPNNDEIIENPPPVEPILRKFYDRYMSDLDDTQPLQFRERGIQFVQRYGLSLILPPEEIQALQWEGHPRDYFHQYANRRSAYATFRTIPCDPRDMTIAENAIQALIKAAQKRIQSQSATPAEPNYDTGFIGMLSPQSHLILRRLTLNKKVMITQRLGNCL